MTKRVIPVVDLSQFTKGDATAREAFVAELGKAFHEIGFVGVTCAIDPKFVVVNVFTLKRLNLDEEKVGYNARFINKIWNITKLVNMNLEGDLELGLPEPTELDLPSKWIVSRLNGLIANVQNLFDLYQYGEAGNQILSFMWDEFAPWYL